MTLSDEERAKVIDAAVSAMPRSWLTEVAREAVVAAVAGAVSAAPRIAKQTAEALATKCVHEALTSDPACKQKIADLSRAAVSELLSKL